MYNLPALEILKSKTPILKSVIKSPLINTIIKICTLIKKIFPKFLLN
jgi:hypothetical protein